MKKLLVATSLIILTILCINLCITTNGVVADNSAIIIPTEIILLDETQYTTNKEPLVLDCDLEIGDIIIFEVYPEIDKNGFWFSTIYTGEGTFHVEYNSFYREIDMNTGWFEIDLVMTSNNLTFTNSYFDLNDDSGFWEERNMSDIFPYDVTTYVRKVVIYKN